LSNEQSNKHQILKILNKYKKGNQDDEEDGLDYYQQNLKNSSILKNGNRT
jgi:hypothetical protein